MKKIAVKIVFPLSCPAEEGEWERGFGGHLAFIQAKSKHLKTSVFSWSLTMWLRGQSRSFKYRPLFILITTRLHHYIETNTQVPNQITNPFSSRQWKK